MSTEQSKTEGRAGRSAGNDRASDATDDTDSPTELPRRSWMAVLRRAIKQIPADELTDRAAALTYYGVQAVFPGLLVLVSIIGLLGHSETQTLLDNLNQLTPGAVTSVLKTVIDNAQHRSSAGLMGIVGLVLALWSASGYVAAFMRAANQVYGMPEGRPIWKTVPTRLGITLFTVVCLVAGLVIVVATGTIASRIGGALGVGSTAVLVWEIVKWPVLLVLFVLMLAVLYSMAPNVRHGGFRWLSPGAVLAVVIWLIASGLFAVYVANFSSYNKTYGSLATVIVFLVWLWISNLAILLGVEFDAELDHERALREGVPEDAEVFSVPKDTRKFDEEEKAAAQEAIDARGADADDKTDSSESKTRR